jgi:hypothetical protein
MRMPPDRLTPTLLQLGLLAPTQWGRGGPKGR